MAFVTGDVIEDRGGESPFKVVFKQGDKVLAEWGVDTRQDGEEEIVAAISSLMDDDDDDDDQDEDDDDKPGPSRGR